MTLCFTDFGPYIPLTRGYNIVSDTLGLSTRSSYRGRKKKYYMVKDARARVHMRGFSERFSATPSLPQVRGLQGG